VARVEIDSLINKTNKVKWLVLRGEQRIILCLFSASEEGLNPLCYYIILWQIDRRARIKYTRLVIATLEEKVSFGAQKCSIILDLK